MQSSTLALSAWSYGMAGAAYAVFALHLLQLGYLRQPRDSLKTAMLAAVGVPSDTSMANFVLARFASEAEAAACDEYLQSQGLIVRRVTGYKLPNCLRITVGDEPSCRRVAHAIGQFKGLK